MYKVYRYCTCLFPGGKSYVRYLFFFNFSGK